MERARIDTEANRDKARRGGAEASSGAGTVAREQQIDLNRDQAEAINVTRLANGVEKLSGKQIGDLYDYVVAIDINRIETVGNSDGKDEKLFVFFSSAKGAGLPIESFQADFDNIGPKYMAQAAASLKCNGAAEAPKMTWIDVQIN